MQECGVCVRESVPCVRESVPCVRECACDGACLCYPVFCVDSVVNSGPSSMLMLWLTFHTHNGGEHSLQLVGDDSNRHEMSLLRYF